jgi:hypothetical protein
MGLEIDLDALLDEILTGDIEELNEGPQVKALAELSDKEITALAKALIEK